MYRRIYPERDKDGGIIWRGGSRGRLPTGEEGGCLRCGESWRQQELSVDHLRKNCEEESPANTHSGPVASSPLFSQAACERVGVHIRLRTDTIDLIVAAQSRALHFISCVMRKRKKSKSDSKLSPNLSQKMGRNNWRTVATQAAKPLRIFKLSFFVSVPHRW